MTRPVDNLTERRIRNHITSRIPAAQAAVAREAAKIINCDPDDPTLASWVSVITVAAVQAGWTPHYPDPQEDQ